MRNVRFLWIGKGAWRDNVFVERLWRTIKYEEVYLHAYRSVPEAAAAIDKYLVFYNTKDPIHRLTDKPPFRFTSTRRDQSQSQHNKG